MKSNLQSKEFHPYYMPYINLTPDIELVEALLRGSEKVEAFILNIPLEKLEYRYEKGKWTIKEILQHIIDTERIFTYRALRIARMDKTPLAGYEQDDYVPSSNANRLDVEALLSDYKTVRACTISLLKSLDDTMLQEIGNANGNNMSARAAFYIIVGHEIHHLNVVQERYL